MRIVTPIDEEAKAAMIVNLYDFDRMISRSVPIALFEIVDWASMFSCPLADHKTISQRSC